MKPIPLLTPYKMGQFDLSHRVVLAPMTRQRAYGGVPQPHAAVYYSQRATPGGLLISEATRVAPARQDEEPSSFRDMPGIWSPEQVGAWRPVVDAVHAKGAVFFCQLWHAAAGAGDAVRQRQQVSPQMSFDGRREELTSPRRVAAEDVPRVVDAFRRAARNAIDAGFDGVELQGTNGYFVDDGGGPESRCRFALEVVDAVAREIGGRRLGLRLDQFTAEPEEHALALHVVTRLNHLGVLYCHMIEPKVDGRRRVSRRLLPFREAFGGTFIASGGYGREEGDAAVGEGYADLVAYGRLFLANPDLPRRFELGAPLNDCVSATFYGAGAGPGAAHPAIGYTDYPFLD